MAKYTATWRDSEDNSETIWGEIDAASLLSAVKMVAEQMPPPWELVSVEENTYAAHLAMGSFTVSH